MPDSHLKTLRFAAAFRDSVLSGYNREKLQADLIAGITVGIIAIPLAMALAIASGVPPQYGLYTSIVAGVVIAITGGSRLSISGPTAAFVVLLYPISMKYGIGGLMLATLMAGLILIVLGVTRLGRLLQFVPNSVVLGFTGGIAIVIATLQLPDFLGLVSTEPTPETYVGKVWVILQGLTSINPYALLVGAVSLGTLILWPRLNSRVPGHLFAITLSTLLAWVLNRYLDADIATIGSMFSYTIDGVEKAGIPPVAPHFDWPWNYPNAEGQPVGLSVGMLKELVGPAMAIAALGAIESLLCAVVLDNMTRSKHNANAELVGQGLGNMIAPFFGGFTATAALARSAANFKAGGRTPMAAVFHAGMVLLAVVVLADLFAYLPMSALAGLLLMVAWNMSEARHVVKLIRRAPLEDVLVLLVCLLLTVFVDMVAAIATGIVLASLLFMKNMANQANMTILDDDNPRVKERLPSNIRVYKLSGPLFFAAAERATTPLRRWQDDIRTVVLYMDGVPVIDSAGAVTLVSAIEEYLSRGVQVIIADLLPGPRKVLQRSGLLTQQAGLIIVDTLAEALRLVREQEKAEQAAAETQALEEALARGAEGQGEAGLQASPPK